MSWGGAWRGLWAAVRHPEYGWKTTHFWGPVANWALVGSAVWDGTQYGPEVISAPMTITMCIYSALFMRFAWAVQPRNYLLLSCHGFNEVAQLNQLYRVTKYKQEKGEGFDVSREDLIKVGAGVAAAGLGLGFSTRIQQGLAGLSEGAKAVVLHPAGPFTIFFWAPTTKWLLSVSNLIDYNRPVDKISTSQQLALLSTGVIWSRYSMVIIPKNYNLLYVNLALATTSLYHVWRKLVAEYADPRPTAVALD
eukprot:TRINITY_DN2882_c0_g1_i1.p1 TRINITY_DN2882_c0_g1~~TRINITY_DN2882_c0_g1_i1.p1  ORF type:complete len:250 (+),score=90.73 TRINITY_DN2882_c0_g1_i1:123-872(+)